MNYLATESETKEAEKSRIYFLTKNIANNLCKLKEEMRTDEEKEEFFKLIKSFNNFIGFLTLKD